MTRLALGTLPYTATVLLHVTTAIVMLAAGFSGWLDLKMDVTVATGIALLISAATLASRLPVGCVLSSVTCCAGLVLFGLTFVPDSEEPLRHSRFDLNWPHVIVCFGLLGCLATRNKLTNP